MRTIKLILLFLIFNVLFLNIVNHHTNAYTETEMDKKKLFKVTKVVDGDTIQVTIRGNKETVRLLGIDTPETVDPRKPVQCFGKAASDKMKSFVLGKYVRLVDDKTQGNRDKYKRLLRYVYLPDSKSTFVNGEMVKQGYAFSYREYPTKMLERFNNWEKYAREHNSGLWGSCSLINTPSIMPTAILTGYPMRIYIAPTKEVPPPVYVPEQHQSGSASGYSGGDKDCGDFATHAEAQSFFISQGGPGSDPHKLDADGDGIACESLP